MFVIIKRSLKYSVEHFSGKYQITENLVPYVILKKII